MNETEVKMKDKSIIEEKTYVTVSIDDELYGIDVMHVQGIVGKTDITHVPNMLPYMKGVINLRGTVVPLIDMRIRFHLEEKDYGNMTVFVIVEIKSRLVGMIVDSVSDVMNVPLNEIQDTVNFSTDIETDFIEGIAQVQERLIIILDINKIISHEELVRIDNEKNSITETRGGQNVSQDNDH